MNEPVVIGAVGVVVGVVAGMVFMMSLHYASTLVYAPPEGVDFMSQEPDNVAKLNE